MVREEGFARNRRAGQHFFLDFGEGTSMPPGDPNKPGMHALLEGPVREVALVSINGQKAGSVWRPPYRVDVMTLLHTGRNHLEIEVANTAINTLAGRSPPDYRLGSPTCWSASISCFESPRLARRRTQYSS